jgi:hypothetical protein
VEHRIWSREQEQRVREFESSREFERVRETSKRDMQLGERHAYGQTDEAERGKCERGEKRRGTRTTRTAGRNIKMYLHSESYRTRPVHGDVQRRGQPKKTASPRRIRATRAMLWSRHHG